MKRPLLTILLGVMLAGCANPIILRNPETSEIAQCDTSSWSLGAFGQMMQNCNCAKVYQAAGWERMN